MPNAIDLTNKVFNRLTVINFIESKNTRSGKKRMWLCRCICGNKIISCTADVTTGEVQSCGCLQKESFLKIITKHGLSTSRFYMIRAGIIQRCLNTKIPAYSSYGGRGIKVCDRWLESFENFRDDMYKSYLRHVEEFGEKDTSIDRKDPDGNYEPSNCRWSTNIEQARNKRESSKTGDFDEHFRQRERLSKLIKFCLTGKRKTSEIFIHYVGITPQEFRNYIESLWEPWMNWDNYGKYIKNSTRKWNIDHIISCNKFDLSIEDDRIECSNYKNLRPYDAAKNLKKRCNTLVVI